MSVSLYKLLKNVFSYKKGFKGKFVNTKISLLVLLTLSLFLFPLYSSIGAAQDDKALNPNPPSKVVRLVFIHHSTGEDWLCKGGLIQMLNQNNYYVTDTTYGWGPDDLDVRSEKIGDHTDIGYWYNWFLGPHRNIYLHALYTNTHTPESCSNSIPDPGGENVIVMFKSCFSSGQVIYGNPNDPPLEKGKPNPLWGQSIMNDQVYTVSNIKGLYRDLLDYFATRQDKMFILITTPPSMDWGTTPESAANLRAINTWLVYHWLDNYPYNNVYVFDYYNVLTSNGGGYEISDVGAETGNHHRFRNGRVQHVIGYNNNYTAYPSEGGNDNHPNPVGHRKAATEFVPLLNIAYHCWKGDGGQPQLMGRSLPGQQPTPTPTASPTPTQKVTQTPTVSPTPSILPTTSPSPQPSIELRGLPVLLIGIVIAIVIVTVSVLIFKRRRSLQFGTQPPYPSEQFRPVKYCPFCGSPVEPGTIYCTNCGKKLR